MHVGEKELLKSKEIVLSWFYHVPVQMKKFKYAVIPKLGCFQSLHIINRFCLLLKKMQLTLFLNRILILIQNLFILKVSNTRGILNKIQWFLLNLNCRHSNEELYIMYSLIKQSLTIYQGEYITYFNWPKNFQYRSILGRLAATNFLQMAHINYPDSHHSQGGLEICHTNFTST